MSSTLQTPSTPTPENRPHTIGDNDIVAIDLFAGAGGFSEGLKQACRNLGITLHEAAINHDEYAISSHKENHPDAHQYHAKIEQLEPPEIIENLTGDPDTNVDLLIAGPECTHFTKARAGKPVDPQRRSSPWLVLDYLDRLNIDKFLIENVKEIQQWGPTDEDNQPSRDGTIFSAWVNCLNKLGYSVDWTKLNAADYGDPTNRDRFFIAGSKQGSVSFPEPTHSNSDPSKPNHKPTAEIIDYSDLGTSIWTRDLTQNRVHSPPKYTTLKRIATGIRRHCSDVFEPFADVLETFDRDTIREIRENRVVTPDNAAQMATATDEPFLVKYPQPDEEVNTQNLRLTEDQNTILLRQQDRGTPIDIEDQPVPTILTSGAHSIATISKSLIMPKNGPFGGLHSNSLYDPNDRPFHTITTDPRAKLVTPQLVQHIPQGDSHPDPTKSDLSTEDLITRLHIPGETPDLPKEAYPLSETFIDNCEAAPKPLTEPLGTVTTTDKFSLCTSELWPHGFDVRYRMLEAVELKQAQGFDADYTLTGVKDDKKRLIGNAVPVNLAKNLCEHLLTTTSPNLGSFGGGLNKESNVDIPPYEEVSQQD